MDLRDEITKVAFELFLESGGLPGHELENWLKAEHLVFTWYEPDLEREKHVGASVLDDHVIESTHEQIEN